MPQAMAGALSPFPDRAGAASSLLGFSQQTCAAILGAIVGHTLGGSAWPIAAPMAVMGCVALMVWAMSRSARQAGEKSAT
jgi:DHA1 family bicyclomycin/chloramphenicol resistance-like MFS transporter